ncbi:hypothetical protein SuNHUV7_22330 (plasmid) [Pseudoseohaeicola sp. NH-UV-7]|uniref:primase-helicase family protein n=1 Tax=Sulfitobacter sp. TBRI5 TaxID=2989732 RepID=UPI003A6640F5
MDANTLASEILRISDLVEIDREPAIQALKTACRQGGYPQQIGVLRRLVHDQVNAESDAQRDVAIDQMVADYFILNMGQKVRIGYFTSEKVNGHKRDRLNLLSKSDFEIWLGNRELVERFIANPKTPRYRGLICDPSKPAEFEGRLNLWRGFGITPKPGDPKPFLDYVSMLLADGNPESSEYILNWLAWVVQRPAERIGVALCLISAKQGTGKGTLGNLMLTIFGQHGVSVSQSEGLTGHFNAHLESAMFCFADEALFAGDLRGADAFKNLITEPWMTVTRKGLDSTCMENLLSILMATNHRFAANVEFSDRRFAMFEVCETKQTRQYWNDLHKWLNAGGKNAVLDFLQRRDLTGFHPVDSRPITDIYLDQRRQSLRETHRWWHDVLDNESLGPMTHTMGSNGTPDKKTVYGLYKEWHLKHEHRASRPVSKQVFWKDIYAMTQNKVREVRTRSGPANTDRERAVCFPGFERDHPMGKVYAIDWTVLQGGFEEWLAQK